MNAIAGTGENSGVPDDKNILRTRHFKLQVSR